MNELVEAVELSEPDVQALLDRIDANGVQLSDDCGREVPEQVAYANDMLAATTTDALQLFLREVRRFDLLTAEEEVELSKRIERGDAAAKEQMINANLRLVVSIARRYQGNELTLLDLIQEGHPGADPRQREVRLAAGLQVLDVRDVVDPPGRRARARQRRPHHPPAGPRRGAGKADRPCAAAARPRASGGRRRKTEIGAEVDMSPDRCSTCAESRAR